MFEFISKNQESLDAFNKRLATFLQITANPGLSSSKILKEMRLRTERLLGLDITIRNNRCAVRAFAHELVMHHCPKGALKLLLNCEIGEITILTIEKDNSIKADAFMRSLERTAPLFDLINSEIGKKVLTHSIDCKSIMTSADALCNHMIEVIKNLIGTKVHNPYPMTIESYMQKNFADLLQHLKSKISEPRRPKQF